MSGCLGCVGCFGLFGLASERPLIVHAVSRCFEFVQVVRLFSFVFGSAKLAALIQVVLVLSFVCSGMIFTIFSCLKLRKHGVFELLRQFGCLRLFHVVQIALAAFFDSSCEGSGDVVGVLTLLVGGVAQAFHDDRVVELRVQLEVEEVKGKYREEQVGSRKGRSESKRVRHDDDHG